jgi:hydroxyacylglutathione hydrolase
MEIVRSMHPDWLVNSWLAISPESGLAVLIDSGGPAEPIVQRLTETGAQLSHVICTHRHPDHIGQNDYYRRQFGAKIAGPEVERQFIGELDLLLGGGEEWQSGDLSIRILAVPGHTAGHMAVLVNSSGENNELHLFSGDVLFRGSVGGTVGVGASGYADLQHSVMKVLMTLPQQTQVHPGHMQSTTIAHEWEHNPIVRFWRGLPTAQEPRPCTVFDRSAVLLVEASDYDGGTKCLIQRDDCGSMDVVPGSKVLLHPPHL